MKKYEFTIRKVLEKNIEIEGENKKQAFEKVIKLLALGEKIIFKNIDKNNEVYEIKMNKILNENHIEKEKDIEKIIRPVGTYTRKAVYIKEISKKLVSDYDGKVPNNREYLEKLPGVGRKTCNVVLSNIYEIPAIAVDTHVERVSKRLDLARKNDTVSVVEKKLMKKFPQDKWSRLHHQMVLFGRYKCKSIAPDCTECKFQEYCKYFKSKRK